MGDHRVVIVTGASRGIGRGIALHLATEGVALAVTGRKPERLQALSEELTELGAPHITRSTNVADHDGCFQLVADTIAEFGRVDGLVANAQTFRPVMPLRAVQPSDMDVLLDTGPKGTLWMMQAVYPHMRAQRAGRIVTMGSHAGLEGASGYGPYAASKEAIRALTRVAAREWGPDGIIVNCVCPVSVAHRLPPSDSPDREAVFQARFADMPLGRDGDPIRDIAPVVSFLLSDECRYMTGQTLLVDGGSMLRP